MNRLLLPLVLLVSAALPLQAQDLEPRAYRTLPTGFNFVLFSYSYSTGNVAADATASLQDLSLDANIGGFGYVRSLGIGDAPGEALACWFPR